MAIIKFVNVKVGNLKRAIKYITNPDKTNANLIYCKDCEREHVLEQFNYIKKFFDNEEKRQYYHFIQSFSPNDNVSHELANKIGQRLCEYFKDYQIIMATHIDTDHLHNHFIMNSVSFVNGKKYQQSYKDLIKLKEVSNSLCAEYELKQIKLDNSKTTRYLKSGEYHLSKKEETEKIKLIKNINKCIKISKSKSQFIYNMNNIGYKVKWQDNRKYITYTTPSRFKFRDKRLLNEKYSKTRMEDYFKRIENKNKVLDVVKNISNLIPQKFNNTKDNKILNSFDMSDEAKKDYLKKKENSSSIEWE